METVLPPSVDGYRQFLADAVEGMVEILSDDDSLFFKVPAGNDPGFHSAVSEAEYIDVDGVTVHLTVHVVRKRLHELEIYKEDGSRLCAPIQCSKIQLVWPRK